MNEFFSGVDKTLDIMNKSLIQTAITAQSKRCGLCVVKHLFSFSGVCCVRTACTSLPVLVTHCEDFLYPVIHGFGKSAELLTFLFPVIQ